MSLTIDRYWFEQVRPMKGIAPFQYAEHDILATSWNRIALLQIINQ
ncbi:MAG: hypothetical protein ACE1ZG_07695 [Gammaproteobacteria bacterium]